MHHLEAVLPSTFFTLWLVHCIQKHLLGPLELLDRPTYILFE